LERERPEPIDVASHVMDAESIAVSPVGSRDVSFSEDAPTLIERKPDSARVSRGRTLAATVKDKNVLDVDDPVVKNEIIQIIIQYLQDEGYLGSALILQDEANVKMKNTSSKRSQLRRIKRAIMSGEWDEVATILAQKATTFRYQSNFLYAVYKQQFLELIDAQQQEKALHHLSKKLKPLERFAFTKTEFRDLTYLLSCQSVTECDQFADWDGANASRALLVDQCARLLDFEAFQADASTPTAATAAVRGLGRGSGGVPPGRLVHLIQQAVAFQVDSSLYRLSAPPRIGTILEDFECMVVPNTLRRNFVGHRGNVKCAEFVGEEGRAVVTGSGDNTAKVWDTESADLLGTLGGHRSRIWDVSTSEDGRLLATASGDGTVRVWNSGKFLETLRVDDKDEVEGMATNAHGICRGGSLASNNSTGNLANSGAVTGLISPLEMMGENGGPDLYAVRFHPNGKQLVTGGYDGDVRLYDAGTGRLLHTFTGHESSVSCIAFNARGTVVMTGSKDSTVRLFDVLSGLCIKTISSHLGEVTSVNTNAAGTLLLTSSKDNSNRLWDMRLCKPLRRYKGHQNTSKNFVRAGFGPRERLVVGGSEDGLVYLWDVDTEDVVGRLGPANGPVYTVSWNAQRSLLLSCSHDGLASTWYYNP
jgi:COMPASS component SWD3